MTIDPALAIVVEILCFVWCANGWSNPNASIPQSTQVMSIHFFQSFDLDDSISYLKFHFLTRPNCHIASDGFYSFGYRVIDENRYNAYLFISQLKWIPFFVL